MPSVPSVGIRIRRHWKSCPIVLLVYTLSFHYDPFLLSSDHGDKGTMRQVRMPRWDTRKAHWSFKGVLWAHRCGWFGIRRGSGCPRCGAYYPDVLADRLGVCRPPEKVIRSR